MRRQCLSCARKVEKDGVEQTIGTYPSALSPTVTLMVDRKEESKATSNDVLQRTWPHGGLMVQHSSSAWSQSAASSIDVNTERIAL